ncbi:chemotaxis protein CheW [Candidatus Colwellia aromaticivorans]|uniref:chemotaxis protein CheW n=1 Tax=Candidatus Colwellia aromaticivorans TaxID=2267621 RepID=UPI001FE6DBE9|nr:chemotaxis protein CheW [Candidatus Colwellia aromaticivorans]
MAKPLAASKKVMKNYLSELMTDEPLVQNKVQKSTETSVTVADSAVENKRLEALLKNVNANLDVKETEFTTHKSVNEQLGNKNVAEIDTIIHPAETSLVTQKSQGDVSVKSQKLYRQGDFQALYFDVGGLILAVPLIELGGIHQVDKTTPLIGKPEWFKGVMLYRDVKINVVDTALWVMPEKCDEKLKKSLNYQYIIMLNKSGWGLSAENLIDTVILNQEEVKWIDSPSKRPWLAGLVKDKMCALLDVDSLIQLLNEGSGIN